MYQTENIMFQVIKAVVHRYPDNPDKVGRIIIGFSNALSEYYSQSAQDADKWITVHPPHGNKSDKGIPVKIDESGTIKAGMGGKFNGENIRNINTQNNTIPENKISYFPKSIAGVKQGKTMSFAQADSGNVNPNYNPIEDNGFKINCQSCVVCFEMRLRGYNVETLPNMAGSALEKLSYDYLSAWIDPATDKKPAPLIRASSKYDLLYKLHKELKENERYILYNVWKKNIYNNGISAHVVNVYKENKNVYIYDPQINHIYSGRDLIEYYVNKIDFTIYPVEVTRIDNLFFNPQYIDSIVKESYTTKQEDL